MVHNWHMMCHEGLVVGATVVLQPREFQVVAWVAEAADDCKDGDEDNHPNEAWDNIENATPTMKLWGR